MEPSLERILALRPDLVLVATSANAQRSVEVMADAGVPVYVSRADSFAGIFADIEGLGRALELPARADALERVLGACRAAKVTGAGFHTARAAALAAATANGNRRFFRTSEAGFSVTARSADGTGSGYFAGDHFDLARLDAVRMAEQAVDKAVRSRSPKPIE